MPLYKRIKKHLNNDRLQNRGNMGFAEVTTVAVLANVLSSVFGFEAPVDKFLFVVGGDTLGLPDNTVEVVSFNETLNPVPECMKNIADYPEEGLEGSTGKYNYFWILCFKMAYDEKNY